MKHITITLLLCMWVSTSALAGDNIVNCEIVVQTPIDTAVDGEAEGATHIATFLPAGDFIFSVFGDRPHMTEVDGKLIRAIMCTRSSSVPSEFDLKIIRTGVPFYLSSNFDDKDSAFLGVSKTDDGYIYSYAGPDMSAGDAYLLKLRMKALNNAED